MSPKSIPPGCPATGTERGFAVAVEGGALVPVTQDLMREVGLLEAHAGVRIARILVRMVDRGQAAEGRFDLGFGSLSADTEHLIGVAHPPGVAFSPGVFRRWRRSLASGAWNRLT